MKNDKFQDFSDDEEDITFSDDDDDISGLLGGGESPDQSSKITAASTTTAETETPNFDDLMAFIDDVGSATEEELQSPPPPVPTRNILAPPPAPSSPEETESDAELLALLGIAPKEPVAKSSSPNFSGKKKKKKKKKKNSVIAETTTPEEIIEEAQATDEVDSKFQLDFKVAESTTVKEPTIEEEEQSTEVEQPAEVEQPTEAPPAVPAAAVPAQYEEPNDDYEDYNDDCEDHSDIPEAFRKYGTDLQRYYLQYQSRMKNKTTVTGLITASSLCPIVLPNAQVALAVENTLKSAEPVSYLSFVAILSAVASCESFNHPAYEPLKLQEGPHRAAELVLCLLDNNSRTYFARISLERTFKSSLPTIFQLSKSRARQESLSTEPTTPKAASDSVTVRTFQPEGMKSLVRRVSVNNASLSPRRRQSSVFGLRRGTTSIGNIPEEFTFTPKISPHDHPVTNENVFERMLNDVSVRRRRSVLNLEEKHAIEAEKLQAALEELNAAPDLSPAKASTFERLHNSRKDFFEKMEDEYSAYYQYDMRTGQKLFQPKINPKSKEFFGSSSSPDTRADSPTVTSESLYANAMDRLTRQQEAEKRAADEIKQKSNTSKMNAKSEEYVRARLARDIHRMFKMLDLDDKGFLGVTHALLILQHFGLFPDVLLMNLEDGGKERTLICEMWKLLKSQEVKNAATVHTITALISATILSKSNKSDHSVNPVFLDGLNNTSTPEGRAAAIKIIRELRLNYHARCPTSQFVGFRLHHDIKRLDERDVVNESRRSRSNSTRPAPGTPVEYTIHGRAQPAGTDAAAVLTPEEISRIRRQELVARVNAEAMAECTFHPQVNGDSSALSSSIIGTTSDSLPVHERLYKPRSQESLSSPVPSTEYLKEQEELARCTFKPNAELSTTAMERVASLREKLAAAPSPRGADMVYDKMQKARELKEEKARREDAVFNPKYDSSIYRDAETGAIKSAPFFMHSTKRGNTKLLKKHGWDLTKRMARPGTEAIANLVKDSEHRDRIVWEKDAGQDKTVKMSSEPILEIDVHMTPTWTQKLRIWKTDSPEVVVKEFAATHGLGPPQEKLLLKKLERELSAVETQDSRGLESPPKSPPRAQPYDDSIMEKVVKPKYSPTKKHISSPGKYPAGKHNIVTTWKNFSDAIEIS